MQGERAEKEGRESPVVFHTQQTDVDDDMEASHLHGARNPSTDDKADGDDDDDVHTTDDDNYQQEQLGRQQNHNNSASSNMTRQAAQSNTSNNSPTSTMLAITSSICQQGEHCGSDRRSRRVRTTMRLLDSKRGGAAVGVRLRL